MSDQSLGGRGGPVVGQRRCRWDGRDECGVAERRDCCVRNGKSGAMGASIAGLCWQARGVSSCRRAGFIFGLRCVSSRCVYFFFRLLPCLPTRPDAGGRPSLPSPPAPAALSNPHRNTSEATIAGTPPPPLRRPPPQRRLTPPPARLPRPPPRAVVPAPPARQRSRPARKPGSCWRRCSSTAGAPQSPAARAHRGRRRSPPTVG